jgi:hypothetical protein
MTRMFAIRFDRYVVFFPLNRREDAQRFRSQYCKGKHIKDVIQAYPSKIEYGKVYERR